MLHVVLLILGILNGLCRANIPDSHAQFICVHENEEYMEGERMYISNDNCLYCECSPTWRGIDDCTREEEKCEKPPETEEGRRCLQIWYPGVCCPTLQCPDETLSGRRRRELFDVVSFTTPMPPVSIPIITLNPGDVVDIDETGTNTQGATPLPVANGFVLHIQAFQDSSITCCRYIQLQFFSFDLGSFHPEIDCTRQASTNSDILQSHLYPEDDDSIPYLDLVDGGIDMKAFRICGMIEGGIFTSTTDQMHILFRPGSLTIPPFTIKTFLRNDCCGGPISLDYNSSPFSSSNIITSGNYPSSYSPNEHCTYTITAASPYKSVCTVFDLTVDPFIDCYEEGTDRLKDTLIVGDSSTILDGETWCGQVPSFSVMSAVGETEIQVHWRTKGTNRGFYMSCMATDANGIPKFEADATCNCGLDTSETGGTHSPFLVKITNSGSGVHECTGVLISKSFVLTLGQCVLESYKNKPLFESTLSLGTSSPAGAVTILPTEIIDIYFPDECGTDLETCLAMVYIPEVTFTEFIIPVCLPLFEVLEYSDKVVSVAALTPGSGTVRVVEQNIYDPRFCDIMFGAFSSRYVCTSADSSTALCNWEKGAAMLVWEDPTDLRPNQQNIFPTVKPHWVLHGINIFPSCNTFSSPVFGNSYSDVYIKVSYYLYWITNLMSTADSQFCARPTF